LPEKHRELRRVGLRGGRCYALAAVGDTDVSDLDLRVLPDGGNGPALASDIGRNRDAVVKVCPETSGAYALDVRMYRGAGLYALQSFELSEPAQGAPVGVEGDSRIAYDELVARLRARGLEPVSLGWGVVGQEHAQSMPVPMRPSTCYAVALVASSDVGASGDLDLTLADAKGRVLAADLGPSTHPIVYHCTGDEPRVHALIQSHQLGKPARFLLLLGEPKEGAQH
jgi:hypothetical protein